MKKSELKTMIREVVREEIQLGLKEVIGDFKQKTKTNVKQPIVQEKKNYSKNAILNDVLNETAQGGDWKTLGGGEFTSDRMNELVGGNYADMMNSKSTPQQVPSNDPMSQFLNKDYREVLKKTEEKDNRKHGR